MSAKKLLKSPRTQNLDTGNRMYSKALPELTELRVNARKKNIAK